MKDVCVFKRVCTPLRPSRPRPRPLQPLRPRHRRLALAAARVISHVYYQHSGVYHHWLHVHHYCGHREDHEGGQRGGRGVAVLGAGGEAGVQLQLLGDSLYILTRSGRVTVLNLVFGTIVKQVQSAQRIS